MSRLYQMGLGREKVSKCPVCIKCVIRQKVAAVLQCVAVCGGVLVCVTVCYSVLQCDAVYNHVGLQQVVSESCSVLQRVAAC